MAEVKVWNGSQWEISNSNNADTLDGKDASEFAPSSHVGSRGSSHGVATESVNGFMSSLDKAKLDNVESGAEANLVTSVNGEIGSVILGAADVGAAPSSHVGSTGSSHGVATESVNGFMSSLDKAKLDNVESGAEANLVTSVNGEIGSVILGAADVGATPSSHVGSRGSSHGEATSEYSGFMSNADKAKLDGVQSGAEVNLVTSVNGETGSVNLSASDVGAASASHSHSYNPTIGADGDLFAFGATFVESLILNDGVITSWTTKTVSPDDVGISAGTANPSGGSSGDVYLQYE